MDAVDVSMLFIVTLIVLYAVNIAPFEASAILVLLNIAGMVADISKEVDA
jgi:hypothetical protein